MDWTVWAGLVAGLLIAVVTAPVGVSGAVFLLPVHLSVFGVPNPAITPTNLLYNVVAGPGALWRYRRDGTLRGPLTRRLIAGTLPGVVLGAAIRVYALPGPEVFQLLVAVLLLPLGLWLCARTLAPAHRTPAPARTRDSGEDRPLDLAVAPAEPRPAVLTALAVGVGVFGGIYGIGGGSLLGPILAARGLPMSRVAPAALAATFATSLVGAAAFVALSLASSGDVAPDWWLGLACGLGGLVGGYLGARLQPRLPETALRLLLGVLAAAIGAFYAARSVGSL
ncbi:TSUP family transporter [Streptomyces sp. NPDC056480]|uniref:TSUP family transporter n=1 Tax=Streptomyces sp. NPDC056480 TaxID=3345833 RepID=UPI003675B556